MRRWFTTVLAIGLILAGTSPASADDRIGLSRDGVNWADTLENPMFDPDLVWVPGDSTIVSFYVRNQAGTDAVLSAAVVADDGDRLLADEHVSLRARAGGEWFPLANGMSSPALTAASISPGQHVRVDLEAAFDPGSSNASQARDLDLTLRVRLADAAADPEPEPEPEPEPGGPTDRPSESATERPDAGNHPDASDDGNDETVPTGTDDLPSTGSDTPAILIWMAVLAITAGAAFVAAGRRERESEDV